MRLGFQSQFIRIDQFKEKHGHGSSPYLCNLVLKLNGKMSSPVDRATAWQNPDLVKLTTGILVMGYTMSVSGTGSSGKMVVCGCCLLDSEAMRFGHSAMVQDRDTTVASILMKRMVKVSEFVSLI